MASIAVMVGGAVLNAEVFIEGNYLARALGGVDKAALDEKVRHDKALEAYQVAYAKYTRDRTKLLDWIATNAQIKAEAKQNFTNTDYAFKLYNQAHPDKQMIPPKSPSSQISINQASSRKMVNSFSWAPGLLLWATLPSGSFKLFFIPYLYYTIDDKLAKIIILLPWGLLERYCRDQKIIRGKVPEETAKKWLFKQALWQIFLPAPKRIPRPKFDVPTPNGVHQADLLFLPHDKLPRRRKVLKYAPTVVDVASR